MGIDSEIIEELRNNQKFYEERVKEAQTRLDDYKKELERTKRLLDIMLVYRG